MAKQIDVNELMANHLKDESQAFVDSEYIERKGVGELPQVRTRYEAYGLLTEAMIAVDAAVAGMKSGMKDCMKSLNAGDSVFAQSAESTYSSLLDCVMLSAEMAVQALNVVYKLEEMITANPPPLVAMAESDEELPDNEESEEE